MIVLATSPAAAAQRSGGWRTEKGDMQRCPFEGSHVREVILDPMKYPKVQMSVLEKILELIWVCFY